jgi:seryl-tRNA synthetase
LRDKLNELTGFFTSLKVKVQDHRANLDELYKRLEIVEIKAKELEKAKVELNNIKCNYEVFKEHADRVEMILTDFDARITNTKNHCVAIDNYLDKYQPVRMQSMIGDTLNACLIDEPRRRHELYDNDKISLLYKMILDDDG